LRQAVAAQEDRRSRRWWDPSWRWSATVGPSHSRRRRGRRSRSVWSPAPKRSVGLARSSCCPSRANYPTAVVGAMGESPVAPERAEVGHLVVLSDDDPSGRNGSMHESRIGRQPRSRSRGNRRAPAWRDENAIAGQATLLKSARALRASTGASCTSSGRTAAVSRAGSTARVWDRAWPVRRSLPPAAR
jgi:hypothetical protein